MATPRALTWTVTFSECVENHAGMQQLGDIDGPGFSVAELQAFAAAVGGESEIVDLEAALPEELRAAETPATVLILRQGARELVGERYASLVAEVKASSEQVDTKAWMRGGSGEQAGTLQLVLR
jgi:hypothetical protein